MNIDVLQTLINTLGFPIVMVGLCGFFIWKMYQVQIEDKDRLYSELGKSLSANEKFAEIISTYTDKIDMIQLDVKQIKERLIK